MTPEILAGNARTVFFAELEKKHRLAGEKVKIIDAKGEDLIRHDIIRFIK